MAQRQGFMDRTLANLMYEVYRDFLTEEEIEDVIDGSDIWLEPHEVIERWAYKQGTPRPAATQKVTKTRKRKPKE